jgi:hypothetical protein
MAGQAGGALQVKVDQTPLVHVRMRVPDNTPYVHVWLEQVNPLFDVAHVPLPY